MRILIVGAGIGGMTLAALLHQRGLRPTLVDRAASFEHAGYMLGLWPLGSRVLHGLGRYQAFVDVSVLARTYEVRDGHGELIKRWSMDPLNERFGPTLSSSRPQLVEVLRDTLDADAIRFNTAVERVEELEHEVIAHLSDGTAVPCDLLVGADGIHSRVRRAVFGDQPIFDTGWGGWVWWADASIIAPEMFVEYWGAGRFLGVYPTTRGLGVFAGGPVEDGFERAGEGRRARLVERFSGLGDQADALLAALPGDDAELFFWRLADVRASEWTRGRVVLLGDAAAGFLPTAGVGASMAMESAAVLADELSRTDVAGLEHALSLYVKRRRRRVESIQDDSRKLARMMFVRSGTVAAIRNLATRFYSLEMLASDLAKALDEPI